MIFKFFNNQTGSVAIMGAISMSALLLAVAVSLDYTSMVSKKRNLQSIADAAVLAAVTSGEDRLRPLKEVALASSRLHGNFEYDLDLKVRDSVVTVTIETDHDMLLMDIFGSETKPISAVAESELGFGQKLNLVLALDTTDSMNGSRIDNMVDASRDLINILENTDGGNGNLEIGLVPFSDYIRIDTAYAGQNWLDVPPDRDRTRQVLDEGNSVNCRQVGSGELATTECDVYSYISTTETVSWVGCMGSRPNGQHRTLGFNNNRYKGLALGACDSRYNSVLPLSDDLENINSAIDNLNTVGRTYIPAGLQWSWQLLEERNSFSTSPEINDADTQKVIVLMTDGENTVTPAGTIEGWDGVFHWASGDPLAARTAADDLTRDFCAEIKGDGIKLITVAYEVADVGTKNMLSQCASPGGNYYDATNGTELREAFRAIGNSFNEVRLTR